MKMKLNDLIMVQNERMLRRRKIPRIRCTAKDLQQRRQIRGLVLYTVELPLQFKPVSRYQLSPNKLI